MRHQTVSWQDVIFSLPSNYSVKRLAVTLIEYDPAQFDRLEFAAGEEVQVDYSEGVTTSYPGLSGIK